MRHWFAVLILPAILIVAHSLYMVDFLNEADAQVNNIHPRIQPSRRLLSSIPQSQKNEEKVKRTIVDGIIKKICNLTKDSLSKAVPQEKDRVVKNIEERLKKASAFLGDGSKYVNLIMDGVKIMAYNNNNSLCTFGIEGPTANKSIARTNDKQVENDNLQVQLVKELASKLEKFALKTFQNATTTEDKLKVMRNLKKRVVDNVHSNKMIIGIKDNEAEAYSNLIIQSLQAVMLKSLPANMTRRTILEFMTNRADSAEIDDYLLHGVALEKQNSAEASVNGTRINFDCETAVGSTCANIKKLNEYTCIYDDTVVAIDKLCDGVIHCPDGADEKNCAKQVVERVQSASRILSEIDLSKSCYTNLVDNSILSHHGEVLGEVLQSQLDFINKYRDETTSRRVNYGSTLSEVVHEVAAVVTTFSIALDGAICSRIGKSKHKDILRRYNDWDIDFHRMLREEKWWPSQCKCQGQFCLNTTCTDDCKRICFHKYSLANWECQAVNKSSVIPLDLICDGKFDCYDETDENNCALENSPDRFEASKIYYEVLSLLSTRTLFKTYETVRTELVSLHAYIKQLQKMSMKRKVHLNALKIIRDKCFAKLQSIYSEYVTKIDTMDEVEKAYSFLLSVNQKIVSALKRSYTGNEKVIPPDGCYCTGDQCTSHICTNKCRRACGATSVLTRFICGNNSNITVAIQSVCDGKIDCLGMEDETDCRKEVCRNHHLMVLRYKLQNVGDKQKGTALGEVLQSWKTKVLANLVIMEKTDRPKPRVIRDVIEKILRDLVTTYSSLEDYKRSNIEYALKKFTKLAQNIIDTIKSCAM